MGNILGVFYEWTHWFPKKQQNWFQKQTYNFQ